MRQSPENIPATIIPIKKEFTMMPSLTPEQINRDYDAASRQYKALGIDTDAALDALAARRFPALLAGR